MDSSFKLTKDLTLGLAGAYDLAMYRSWANGPCAAEYSSSAVNCSMTGRPVAGAPKWAGDLSATYQHNIADDWIGYVRGDINYKSSFFGPWVQDDSQFSKVKSNWLANIAMGSKILDGRLDVNFWVHNIFNRHYVTYTGSGFNGSYLAQIGDPQTFGLTTSLKF